MSTTSSKVFWLQGHWRAAQMSLFATTHCVSCWSGCVMVRMTAATILMKIHTCVVCLWLVNLVWFIPHKSHTMYVCLFVCLFIYVVWSVFLCVFVGWWVVGWFGLFVFVFVFYLFICGLMFVFLFWCFVRVCFGLLFSLVLFGFLVGFYFVWWFLFIFV